VTWDRLRASYDAVAADYEQAFLHELDAKPFDRDLLTDFAASTGDPIAEIGCGPGQVGAVLRRVGRTVVGADLSPEMAKLARHRLDAALVADMGALPFGGQSCAGVVAFYAVIHLPRPELPSALREFKRILRPEGRLVFSAHEGEGEISNDDFLGRGQPFVATLFQLDELAGATRDAGLEVVGAIRRDPYPQEHPTKRLYVEAAAPR
jgi:SAM-dependent methyltransferase